MTESFHPVLWLPLVTCDKHTPLLRDNEFLSGDHPSPLFTVWILIWLVGWDFSREPIKIITKKKKKIIKGLTVCCADEYICDKDKRKDLPSSCVAAAWCQRDCAESWKEICPRKIDCYFLWLWAKNGERVNKNGLLLNIITGLYRSWFESSRKGKEPTLVPETPLWFPYLSLSLILLLVLLQQWMTQEHKWTVILVLLETGEKGGGGGGFESWLEHVPWDLVKCTLLSSESTWLHSTNDCIKRATESLFVGTRVRERVWAKAENGLEACSVGWTAGMLAQGTSASHGRVFLWQRKVIGGGICCSEQMETRGLSHSAAVDWNTNWI